MKPLTALLVLFLAVSGMAQERVPVRRMADTVAIRTGPERNEHVLYFFAASAELGAGDELEQGSSGHSQIFLSGGGFVELHGSTHVILERLDPKADVLTFPLMTIAYVVSGERPIVCRLPGGFTCRMQQTDMIVRVEPGRLRVRNQGGQPIHVSGAISLEREKSYGKLTLGQGQEAILPLLRSSVPEPPGTLRESWGVLSVRHSGKYAVKQTGADLEVEAADDPEAPANDLLIIGGVRTDVDEGVLRLSNHRREVPDPLDVRVIVERITGSSEDMTPEAVQQLLIYYTFDQLREIGAEIIAEQDAENAKAREAADAEAAAAPQDAGEQNQDQQPD
jgi:hypothetical protein